MQADVNVAGMFETLAGAGAGRSGRLADWVRAVREGDGGRDNTPTLCKEGSLEPGKSCCRQPGYDRDGGIAGGVTKEKAMELEDLITQLQAKLDDADLALDAGNRDTAREALREAKSLLDDEFLTD